MGNNGLRTEEIDRTRGRNFTETRTLGSKRKRTKIAKPTEKEKAACAINDSG